MSEDLGKTSNDDISATLAEIQRSNTELMETHKQFLELLTAKNQNLFQQIDSAMETIARMRQSLNQSLNQRDR